MYFQNPNLNPILHLNLNKISPVNNSGYSRSNSQLTTRYAPSQNFTTSNVSQSPSILTLTPSLNQSYIPQSRPTSNHSNQQSNSSIYQSRIMNAPIKFNKAIINPPQKQIKIQYIPFQTKQIVYDTVHKAQIVPVHKITTQYETLKHQELIPIEKAVTDFIAIQHITNYKPITYESKVLDYIQQEVIEEKVNYKAHDFKRVLPQHQRYGAFSQQKSLQSRGSEVNMIETYKTVPDIQLTTSTYDVNMLGSQMTLMTSMISQPRGEIDSSITQPLA